MTAGSKGPKKVASTSQSGSLCKVGLPLKADMTDLTKAVQDLSKIIFENTSEDLAKLAEKSQKKLAKKMSK